ncbi:MAG TPA: hypothetical protein VMJ49_11100 [Gaiellaceae bacterium]|nr:hypothetical protein [Gaiellaceae bacterium]
MGEVLQPLAAEPKKHPVRALNGRSHDPSFAELVYSHFAWWRDFRDDARAEAESAYHELLTRFERSHGKVVHSFWCSHVASAVALTEQKPRYPWQRATSTFHRESDWATRAHPEITLQLHRCDDLAVRARTVLTGVRQRICLQLVAQCAGHLLALVDGSSHKAADVDLDEALATEIAALDEAEKYYRQAANGQAQIVYFTGMVSVAAVTSILAFLFLQVEWKSGVAAFVAGSVGAVVSVIQRINNGSFELSYDVGRPYAFFLGGLRPLIGGAFALAITFAFTSGILHLPISASDPAANDRLAILVVGFLAGFSERWAQDTLTTALPAGETEQPKP